MLKISSYSIRVILDTKICIVELYKMIATIRMTISNNTHSKSCQLKLNDIDRDVIFNLNLGI